MLAHPYFDDIRDDIELIHMDAQDYDYRDADLIYIVPILYGEVKHNIMENICNCPKAHLKLVFTFLSSGLVQIPFEPVPQSILKRLFQKPREINLPSLKNPNNHPVLLTPKVKITA
jgi:hypothetical protein